jgi:amidase
MADHDLLFLSATELAGKVRAGELAARELVELSLARIDELDGELNAFVEVDAERALATASEVKPGDARPFAGVPIAIKDNRAVQGLRLTYGCPLMSSYVPDYDASVTRRLKEAGFIVVGTTTLPEYGILPVSEASLFGPTRNPWDTRRTPGGSSGGSGAAVAAGMVPVAHGNDGGGSIRIPAACCGLVGLKAQRDRVSCAPELSHSLLVADGVLTRTVADTASILDAISGPETGDASWVPPPPEPFARAAAREPGRARIAFTTEPPIADAPVDPLCAGAVTRAAELLSSLGHEVQEVEPPWPVEGVRELFGAVFSTHIALSIAYSGMIAGREPTEADMEPMSWAINSMVARFSAVEALGMEARLLLAMRRVIAFMEPYDALLTPALAERPLPIGTLDTSAPEPMSAFTRSAYFTPFTALFNASGQPAVSVPLFHGDDGLPLAVQLAGNPAHEGILLALASQLEAVQPWRERRPEMASSTAR